MGVGSPERTEGTTKKGAEENGTGQSIRIAAVCQLIGQLDAPAFIHAVLRGRCVEMSADS